MGEVIGHVVHEVVDAIGDEVERHALAKALRDVAGKIERGDIVPDEMLARAKRRAADVAAARAGYREG